ncbi:MAG: FGGY-family carbohydrate kinase, partial [Pacificimonas sp.]
ACTALKAAGHEAAVQAKTGLLLDPYFSATKIGWALENWPEVARAAEAGTLYAATVDAWLRWKLSSGESWETDASNAARTLLMDLKEVRWDAGLMKMFGVPEMALPFIGDCSGALGTARIYERDIPVTGAAGDQQAAAVGQACFAPGAVKATYGTGAFLIANAGAAVPTSDNRLLATLGWALDGKTTYALEGSLFVAGSAVQWLRDSLGIIGAAEETEALATAADAHHGVMFVPAFAGLGAPWWDPEASGAITGLTGGSGRAEIVHACLSSMGDQTGDVLSAMAADGVEPGVLKIDGGMVANDWLCQDLADALGIEVERPEVIETTAMGAAMLAGVGAGLYGSLEDAEAAMRRVDRRFAPLTSDDERAARRARWTDAVKKVMA